MFKIGDIIRIPDWVKPSIYDPYGLRTQSFLILEIEKNLFHEDELVYTLKGLKDNYTREIARDDFELDEKYIRTIKLKRICSKLGM